MDVWDWFIKVLDREMGWWTADGRAMYNIPSCGGGVGHLRAHYSLVGVEVQLEPTRLPVLKQAKLHNMARRVIMKVECFESPGQSS